MSYNISVSSRDGGYDMNWLRNPFGLCQFAEDNAGDGDQSLWHVCNDHSYEQSMNVDRGRFLRVVSDYWDRIRGLESAHFFFTFGAYVQFAPSYPDAMLLQPRGWRSGESRWEEGGRLAISVAEFQRYDRQRGISNGFAWRGTPVLTHYKQRFENLLELANAMQDPDASIHISS